MDGFLADGGKQGYLSRKNKKNKEPLAIAKEYCE